MKRNFLLDGFGSENIDIVINEFDTLANVDYNTREEKDSHRVLTMVNIGSIVDAIVTHHMNVRRC